MANPPLPYHVGDPVRVTNGSLAGFAAKVREVDGALGRLKLDVAVRGTIAPVLVETWQVERAAPQ